MEGLWIQVSDWVTYVLAKHFDLQARPQDALESYCSIGVRQDLPDLPAQLLRGKRLLNKRVIGIQRPLRHHPMRRKSRHIEHPNLGPAPGNRVAQLPSSETRHGDIGQDGVDPVSVALEHSYGFVRHPAPRVPDTPASTQHPRREAANHLLVIHHEEGLRRAELASHATPPPSRVLGRAGIQPADASADVESTPWFRARREECHSLSTRKSPHGDDRPTGDSVGPRLTQLYSALRRAVPSVTGWSAPLTQSAALMRRKCGELPTLPHHPRARPAPASSGTLPSSGPDASRREPPEPWPARARGPSSGKTALQQPPLIGIRVGVVADGFFQDSALDGHSDRVGVVFRFRLRRRPSEASRAARSRLQMVGGSAWPSESSGRPALKPLFRGRRSPAPALPGRARLSRHPAAATRRRESLQRGDRFQITPATGAGLQLSVSPVVRHQGSQLLMLPFATIDAEEPLDLPLCRAAAAPKPATAIETSPLCENRPGRANRTVAVRPVAGNPVLQQAAADCSRGSAARSVTEASAPASSPRSAATAAISSPSCLTAAELGSWLRPPMAGTRGAMPRPRVDGGCGRHEAGESAAAIRAASTWSIRPLRVAHPPANQRV